MTIPKHVWIKGEKWKVKWVKNLTEEGIECYGLADYDNRVISLDKDLKKDKKLMEYTFLHELNHAALHELHIDIPRELDETISDGLAFIYHQLFDIKMK